MDEGARDATQPVVARVAAVEIEHISTMLAMHTYRHPGQPAHEHAFYRRQVAGMQDVGAQRAQRAPQADVMRRILARLLLHVMEDHATGTDALHEMRMSLQAHHMVFEVALGEVVEQVDHAVLEATRAEMMNDMNDALHGETALSSAGSSSAANSFRSARDFDRSSGCGVYSTTP